MSRLPFLSRGKLHVVETDNANTKRLIGQYWGDAVAHFRATGDTSRLDRYRNRAIAGHPFEVDPEVIEDFLFETDFDFQELYEP
jgi:hypothetical protein